MKRKIQWIVIIIVFVFSVIVLGPKEKVSETNQWMIEDVLVISHAGGKLEFPGNTMSAFANSYDLGVDVLEMDVQITSDDILVLRHGENETGNIRKMSNCDAVLWDNTYEYFYNNCNFGYNFEDVNGEFPYRDMTNEEWIEADVALLKLEDLFLEYGNTILYIIEIKADADAPRNKTADVLVELIEAYDLIDEVMVATSFEDISLYIREEYPKVLLSASHAKAQETVIKSYSLTDMFLNPDGYYALHIPTSFDLPVIQTLRLDTKLLVNRLHKHNIAVHYWTINDESVMEHLIDIGADGIMTDDPRLLLEVLDR